MSGRRACLLALALLLAACGEPPTAPPIEVHVGPLEDAPRGDALPEVAAPSPGTYVADVEKTWEVVADAAPPRKGRARLEIRLRVEDAGGLRVGHLAVRVVETEGVAARYVSGYDGLALSFAYGEQGRPEPRSVRYEGEAPEGTGSFLKGLWGAGFGLSTPWIPTAPIRVGGSWPREDMGDVRSLSLPAGGTVRLEGGGRLVALGETDGEPNLAVELDTLVETDVRGPTEDVRLAIHDRGTATLRARDGLPVDWTLAEATRLRRATTEGTGSLDVDLHVQGTLRAAGRDAGATEGSPGSDR